MSMFHSRRCSDCELNWPPEDEYLDCPACQRTTWLSPSPQHPAMDADDARSRANHFEFERHYAQHVERQALAEIEELTGA